MKVRIPLRGTPAAPYLLASAKVTEEKIAELRIFAAAFVFIYGGIKLLTGAQEYLTPPGIYLAGIIWLLVYSVVYRLWRPYERFSVVATARLVNLNDFLVATILIINNGGFASPYWALLALVALIYVVRFGRTRLEFFGGVLLFSGAVAITQSLQAVAWPVLLNVLLGVGVIIVLIVEVAVLLVGREREAITGTFEMELNAVRRMINTIQHEIYNPLASAKGNVALIRQEKVPDSCNKYLDSLDQALRTIENVVQRLQQLERERLVRGIGNLEVYRLPDAAPETP